MTTSNETDPRFREAVLAIGASRKAISGINDTRLEDRIGCLGLDEEDEIDTFVTIISDSLALTSLSEGELRAIIATEMSRESDSERDMTVNALADRLCSMPVFAD